MTDEATHASERWDAGDRGCARLIVGLRARLLHVDPGTCLEVRAKDPAAPIDIAAWCRMTGHELVSAKHPVYVIRRRSGPVA